MVAPKEIEDLVSKFDRNYREYMSSDYNEAEARQEFINLLFKALGWDMYNDQGLSDAHKEVLYEPNINTGSTTISPDYAFKIGESIKFLVEAKKPSVNLKWSINPEYQLRTYAWNAKLPISILTDFEEFVVYDCRSLPKRTDNADTAPVCYLRYTEYPIYWDWISSKFSKTAIQQGCLDKLIDDAAFLEEISKWKEELKQYPSEETVIKDETGEQAFDPNGAEIREPSILIRINQLYRSEMDADSLYDATRGVWVIGGKEEGGRRDGAKYAFSVFKGIIIEVYKIEKWYLAGTQATFYKTRPGANELYTYDPPRWEFKGEVAEREMREKYLNKSVKRYLSNGSQNPIKYVNC